MFWNNLAQNSKWFGIITLMLFSFCSIALAESGESDSQANTALNRKSVKAFFDQLSDYDAKGIFASHPKALPFHVEMSVYVYDSKRTPLLNFSEVYEWDGKKPYSIGRVKKLGTRFVLVDRLGFYLIESGKWDIKTGVNWGMAIDEDLSDLVAPSHVRAPNKWRIQVEPMEFVSSHIAYEKNDSSSYMFNKKRKVIQFQLNKEKGVLWLVTRIPSDQLRYGYPLESIWISKEIEVDRAKGKEKAYLIFSLNSFASGKNLKLLMQNPRKLERYETLLPKHTFVKNQPWGDRKCVGLFKSDKYFSSSDQLYRLFASNGPAKDDPQNEQIKKTAAQIRQLMKFGNQLLQNKKEGEVISQKEFEEKCDNTIDVLRQLSLQSYMQEPNQFIAIQDQFMRWKYLESCYGATKICKFYDEIITTFLLSKKLDNERLCFLTDAIADLGYPRHAANGGKTIDARKKNLLVESMFSARWSIYGWTKEHLELCMKADGLKSNSLALSNVFVENLIRMDATNKVQPKKMQAWFQSEIIQTTERERIMNLSILSLQPSGRDYLLKRLDEGIADKVLYKEIVKHLNARVDATVQTKRYDFMSQAECNRIKKATGR